MLGLKGNLQAKHTLHVLVDRRVGIFFLEGQVAPCKGIRIPESRNFLLVESGILGFGIRNPALGIRNPTKDWNPESKLPKDPLQIGLSYSLERKAIYGKPP